MCSHLLDDGGGGGVPGAFHVCLCFPSYVGEVVFHFLICCMSWNECLPYMTGICSCFDMILIRVVM